MNKGFSLVELSVVIVIIGLILAAITSGTALIKQAEVRAIVAELDQMKVGYIAFVDRYGAKPGDFDSGEGFWGTDCAETAANCNGNGNGYIDTNGVATNADQHDEMAKAYVHLALSDLIPGSIVPIPDTYDGTKTNYTFPSEIPSVKFTFSSQFTTHYLGSLSYVAWPGNTETTSFVIMGRGAPDFRGVFLTPTEAYNIDKKIDDGKTVSGAALGFGTGNFSGNNLSLLSADCQDTSTTYDVTASDAACSISYKIK